MPTYKTPDVYVEEISNLPPSVAEVSTAIPAFIGYTEVSTATEEAAQVARISTFLDYQNLFGGPEKTAFETTVNSDNSVTVTISEGNAPKFLMYYALDLYFKNGGGPCYIISVGTYNGSIDSAGFTKGLATLEKEDEPTIIAMPDAVNITDKSNYYSLCNEVLVQCHKLGDRFGIFDVLPGDTRGENFRNGIRSEAEYLKYGAAYTPCLQTTITQQYNEDVQVKNIKAQYRISDAGNKQIKVTYVGDVNSIVPRVSVTITPPVIRSAKRTAAKKTASTRTIQDTVTFAISNNLLAITLPNGGASAQKIKDTWDEWKKTNNPAGFDLVNPETGSINNDLAETQLQRDFTYQTHPNGIQVNYTGAVTNNIPKLTIKEGDLAVSTVAGAVNSPASITITVPTAEATPDDIANVLSTRTDGFEIVAVGDSNKNVTPDDAVTDLPLQINTPTIGLANLKSLHTGYYNTILAALDKEKVVLPPSSAMAGIYAATDRNRGVWKAPANVSIVSVTGPVEDITGEEQENLNVHPTAGKSINAIRSFTGKGTLVWGARTLAGNDNEWRYISTRRLFNTIEESCKKSTQFAIFEPNDANTWLKVKAMTDSYLYGLWQQGALAGAIPEDAYYVNVGTGKTMTSQDILEGRMIVEIGIAAVRPAEFILLRFSHQMQES